jgi:2-methylcitrate dehydratase PrpD
VSGNAVLCELAAWGGGTADRAGPDDRRTATTHLLDTLGCLVVGASHPVAGRMRARLALDEGSGRTRTLGVPATSLPSAVAYEAVLAHLDEFDGVHAAGAVAPSAVVVPAALAVAAQEHCTGRELLDAVLIGIEVVVEAGLRFGGPALYARRWWPTALFGALGAAAATARLLGLDEDRTRQSLALAAAELGGPLATGTLAEGHYLLSGRASAAGVAAARGASLGMTGDLGLLDGAVPAMLGVQPIAPTNPARPHVNGVSLKRYPFARPLSAVLAAIDELVEQRCPIHEVTQVEVRLPEPLLAFVTAVSEPPGPADAAASAAVAWAARSCARERDVAFVRDAAPVQGPSMALVADEALTRLLPARWGAEVIAWSPDGRFRARVEVAPGDPGAELEREEVSAKFRRNTSAVGQQAAEGLAAGCFRIEELPDAAELRDRLLQAH